METGVSQRGQLSRAYLGSTVSTRPFAAGSGCWGQSLFALRGGGGGGGEVILFGGICMPCSWIAGDQVLDLRGKVATRTYKRIGHGCSLKKWTVVMLGFTQLLISPICIG